MSEPTELVEEAAAVRGDAFVEVNYDDRIPNNVDLSSDPRASRRRRSTCAPPWGWTRAAGPSSAT